MNRPCQIPMQAGSPAAIIWEQSCMITRSDNVGGGKGRAPARWAKSATVGEEMGRRTRQPSRGKSGRHVTETNHFKINWRDPAESSGDGRKGEYKAKLKVSPAFHRESEMVI